jgi:CRAL/TRIO domain
MTLFTQFSSSSSPFPTSATTAVSMRLRESFPHATLAECDRFDKAFQSDASSHLAAYLDWRSEHGLDDEVVDSSGHAGSDKLHWVEATDRAMAYIFANNSDASSEKNMNNNKKMYSKTKKNAAKVSSSPHEPDQPAAIRSSALSSTESSSSSSGTSDDVSLRSTTTRYPTTTTTTTTTTVLPLRARVMATGTVSVSGDGTVEHLFPTTTTESSGSLSASPFSLESNSQLSSPLVRFVRCHWVETVGSYLKDKTGHRILHLLPAQVSLDNGATEIESYVLALSFYLERKLRRDSDEQLTLLIDARSGRGWPNLPALQMITFVRRLSTVLSLHFPCRLHKCIIYPMPRAALVIWKFFQVFLSPSLRQQMVLIAGSATEIESPLPQAQLEEYVPREGIELMEETRRESFSSLG